MILPWWPVVWIDVAGSATALAIGLCCILLSWRWTKKKPVDAFRHYVFLLTLTIGAFTVSRSVGHLLKQVLLSLEMRHAWHALAPFSGSINTATFVTIFAFSIYFDRLRTIKLQAERTTIELATARTRAAAGIEAEIRLRAILDGFTDAIYVIDRNRRILFCNDKLVEIMPSVKIGSLCHESLYSLQEPCSECRLGAVLDGQSYALEKEIPDPKMTVHINEIPLQWPDGQQVKLTVLRDITEKKLLEAQLLHAQKMEAVGVLAGGIAHDFNNLLTVISGYTEIIRHQSGADSFHDDLAGIGRATRQAAALTRQLLLFSRHQKPEMKVVEVGGLIRGLQKMLQRFIGEDIEMVTEMAAESLLVKADQGQMEQVLMNLVINARDAMPGGGRIVVQGEEVALDAHYCRTLLHARPGRFVRLTVSDTGAGMSKEILGKIFEPFFTTKGLGKGTGLGLSVVYGIVEQHGGWINVYSEIGRGSTFRVYLPAISPESAGGEEAGTQASLLERGTERILLVEDEEDVRRVTLDMLSLSGYRVTAASTLEEAAALFAREEGRFDLVLSDIVLPDGNGLQVMEQLQAAHPDLPVLLMSGYADEKSQWPAILKRQVPFLQKPFNLADLLAAVRRALQK